MSTLSFQYVNLYRCSYGAYTAVVVAPTPKHARLVFEKWLGDVHHVAMGADWRVKRARTIGQSPLIQANYV